MNDPEQSAGITKPKLLSRSAKWMIGIWTAAFIFFGLLAGAYFWLEKKREDIMMGRATGLWDFDYDATDWQRFSHNLTGRSAFEIERLIHAKKRQAIQNGNPAAPALPPTHNRPMAPPVQAITPAKPRNNRARWVTATDYPAKALQNDWQGRTRVLLDVRYTGRVQNCRVIKSSGHTILDQAACSAISRRALFSPARDHEGRPVDGKFQTTVAWVLPRGQD